MANSYRFDVMQSRMRQAMRNAQTAAALSKRASLAGSP